ncbi:MAG: phage portal protein [Proteobacteria bacterium]|nr:phage portal protein [Pseudomonadota bacterium]
MILNLLRKAGLLKRSYDGAAGGRRWRGAGEMPVQRTAMIAGRDRLASRARYLAANNALAASAAEAWASALVGTGIKPQSLHPDPDVRAALNLAWERWTAEADADGLTDFYGLQTMAARQMIVTGDVLGLIVVTDDQAGVPLRLRLVEAEQVDPALHRELPGGARIVSGIEFDSDGRRVAYHAFREPPGAPLATALDMIRIPAEDVVHLFRATAPGQVRGISWFAPALLRLADLDQAHDAQLMRQKVAALLAGFVVDPNGDAGAFTGERREGGILDGGLEPGTLKVLDPGQDVRFSDPATIGMESLEFLKLTAREIAAGLGLPEHVLTGDLSGANYSSLRAGLVEFRRKVEAIQHACLVHQFCRPVWQRFVETAALSGEVVLRDFDRYRTEYLAVKWITPRFDWVDPAKDAEAEVASLAAGLMSPREAAASRGYDLEALYREIAEDRALAAKLGLTFSSPAAARPKEAA